MSAVLTTTRKAASPFDQLLNPPPPRVAPADKDLVVLERRSLRSSREEAVAITADEVVEPPVPPSITTEASQAVAQKPRTCLIAESESRPAQKIAPTPSVAISPERVRDLLRLETEVKSFLDLCPGAIRVRRMDAEDLGDSLKRTMAALLAKAPDASPTQPSNKLAGGPQERDDQAVESFLPQIRVQAQILSRRGLKGWSDKSKFSDAALVRDLIKSVEEGDYAQVACRSLILHSRDVPSDLLTSAWISAKKAYVNTLREACGRVVPGNAAPLKGTITFKDQTIYCDEAPLLRWCGKALKTEILTWVAQTLEGERLVPINHASVYGDMRHSMLLISHALKGFEIGRWGSAAGQYKVWVSRLQDAVKRVEVDLLLDAYSRETRATSTLRYAQYAPYVNRMIEAIQAVGLLASPESVSQTDWQVTVIPHVVAVDEALSDIDWIAI